MAFTISTHDPSSGVTIPSTWGDEVNSNFVLINRYFFTPLFPESSGQVDTKTAAMLYATGTGIAGTPLVEFPVLQANGTATSARKWTRTMPPAYGGSVIVSGRYYMPVAGSANFVLGVRVSAFTTGGTVTAEAFGTQVKGTVTASTIANKWTAFSITIPTGNVDSVTAGDPVQIEFERLPTDAGDTEAGTVNIVNLAAYFNASGY